MNTTLPTSPSAVGRPPAPSTQFDGTYPGNLRKWMIARRNENSTPDQICADLVRNGWDADSAAAASIGSLRTGDRHQLLYNAVCWGAGLGALGAGTAAHLALASSRDPIQLASAITVMMVATPIAITAGIAARRVEAREPHAIWSPTRRVLFATLATCTAVVGLLRLLTYTFNAVAAAVKVPSFEFTPASVVQVMVTVSLAGPLFWWSLTEWRRSNVALLSLQTAGRQAEATGSDTTPGTVEA